MFGSRPSEQGAAIYWLADATLVHSMDKAASGVWIAGDFAVLLSRDAPLEELGDTVDRALAASRYNVPHPNDWKSVGTNVLVVARRKTWRALEKGAVLSHVVRDRSNVRIVPTRNGGPTGDDRGFHEMPDRQHNLNTRASRVELGQAVTVALNDSAQAAVV